MSATEEDPCGGLLPDVRDTLKAAPPTAWTRLLSDRFNTLLTNELIALREKLIGSDALIAMVKAGATPAELSNAITSKADTMRLTWIRLDDYVRDAAWGDAGARHLGMLPAAPASTVTPVKALKSTPVDWEAFWKFVEEERAEGSLRGKAAWADPQGAQRTRVGRTLTALNKKFSE